MLAMDNQRSYSLGGFGYLLASASSRRRLQVLMMVIDVPAEIRAQNIFNRLGHGCFCRGDMMLITTFANELKQLLEIRQFYDAITAKCVEFFLGEPAFSEVGGHLTAKVIGGDSAISEWPRRNATDDCSIRV